MADKVSTHNHIQAKEFEVNQWIDGNGNKSEAVTLADLNGQFKVVYCFQSWCPGCHSKGLPDLKKMVGAMQHRSDISFLAIQTVFEGFESNTYNKIEAQIRPLPKN